MNNKVLKMITISLVILVICLISFVGVYSQELNKMENKVKNYEYSKDLNGYREIVLKVSEATEVQDSEGKVVGNTDNFSDETIESNSYVKTENPVNSEESLNKDNYEKTKNILENRLKYFGIQDYELALNKEDGTICIHIPENNNTDKTVSNLLQVGNFELKDSEDTTKIYLKNENIKKASAVYNTSSNGTIVYLKLDFNKAGEDTLKEISNGEYKTSSETTSDDKDDNQNSTESEKSQNDANIETSNNEENKNSQDTENEDNKETTDTQKKITISIDTSDLITTSFNDPIDKGSLNLSMNKETTDTESLNSTLQSTSAIAGILNSGKLPLTYNVLENNFVGSDISKEMIKKTLFIIGSVVILALAYLIIRFKLKGVYATISFIGFVAIDLLLIRYTNVEVSIESFVAGLIILAINFATVYKLAKINEKDPEINKNVYKNAFKNTIQRLLPIFIISIVFVFMEMTKISTLGMFMFWGLFISVIYNYILTKKLFECR